MHHHMYHFTPFSLMAAMVWYDIFIYLHYTDEYKTRLKVNVQNKYKSIHIKT